MIRGNLFAEQKVAVNKEDDVGQPAHNRQSSRDISGIEQSEEKACADADHEKPGQKEGVWKQVQDYAEEPRRILRRRGAAHLVQSGLDQPLTRERNADYQKG